MIATRVKLEIAAAIVVLAGGGVGFHSWKGEHDAKIIAEVTAKVAQKAFDQAGEQMKIERAADAIRDKQAADTIAGILAKASAAKTPEQSAEYLRTQLPTKIPIEFSFPKPTTENPNPKAIASIAREDLPILRDATAKCEADAVGFSNCKEDLASRDRQIALAKVQIKAVQDERDTWKKAAGGTKWQRARHLLELGLALGVGIAVDRAAQKK